MVNTLGVVRQRIHQRVPSTSPAQMKNQTSSAPNSVHPVIKLQQQFGNRHVMRQLVDSSHLNTNGPFIQRDGAHSSNNSKPEPTSSVATKPPLKEVTVPIPQQHPITSLPSTVGTEGQTPAAPEQAKIRIPINFDYQLLPPELKVRLLDEFNITAKVTEANLQWQHDRVKLGLNYEYGETLSGQGSYRAQPGTFSGKASYDPSTSSARFGLGFDRDRLHIGGYATTRGEYGAELSYGMKPLPDPDELENTVRTGEQSARNVVRDLPAAADPTKLPNILKAHKKDFSDIGDAISPIVDLAKRDTTHIDWGFYFRFSKGPYHPSGPYQPYFQQFEGQDEYRGEAGVVGHF